MPIITQPALIEQSDFTTGWSPDGLNDSTDPTVLLDVLNLLIDRNTGSLEVRDGFRRLREEFEAHADGADLEAGHTLRQVYHYSAPGDNYLVFVASNGEAEADNVQLFAINVTGAGGLERIDDAGVTWSRPNATFWFQTIDGILYGGSKGNLMFSWDAATGTWDDDAATPNTKAWVDATGAGVTTASEYARDYAWTGKEFVAFSGDVFQPQRDLRYDKWESGERYRVGERVSRKGDGYFRSYRCTDAHVADAAKAPDTGADWEDYWKRVKLDAPQDEDGETNDGWSLIPEAAQTSIAMWYADRLFLRFDGQGDNSRAQYSAPVKPDKRVDIPNVSWNPKDWAPGNDAKGSGGGWVPFNDGKHGGVITAMTPFGQYGVIFKRRAVWVISGTDETTWNVRRAGRGSGCVGPQAFVEVDGLLYYLADDGLYATDGTQCQEVPANRLVQQVLKARLDSSLARAETDGAYPTLFTRDGFVGISIPDATNATTPHFTLFYDPETGGFWPTDLPVLDWANYRDDGIVKSCFVRSPASTSDTPLCIPYIYNKASNGDADDTGADTYATANIAWYLRTSWLPFGTLRSERRIRRVWWLVKGAITYTLKQYRNYDASTEAASSTRAGAANTGYIEGKWMADAHSMQMRLSGASAPASIYGYAVDTEPRRPRYHN